MLQMDDCFPHHMPLAIIGMACRLPGADNLDQFWRLLIEGRTAIAELPADRLDQEMYYDPQEGVRGKTYSKLGAIISSRQFDRTRARFPNRWPARSTTCHLLDVRGGRRGTAGTPASIRSTCRCGTRACSSATPRAARLAGD